MLKLVEGLFWISLPVGIGFMVDPIYGWAMLALMVFLITLSALVANWRTKDIYYTKILRVKEVYKRGHRYAGSSIGWFEGQPVAHFAYGKWHEGTKVLFEIHYRPGALMKNQNRWVMVGDSDYNVFMEHLVEDSSTLPPPKPIVKTKPKGHPLVRFIGYLLAGGLTLFALLMVIVSVTEKMQFVSWIPVVVIAMIPSAVIFSLLWRTRGRRIEDLASLPEKSPVKTKPKGHPLVRFIGYVLASGLALFSILMAIVGITEKIQFGLWLAVVAITMIPAVVIFALLWKTRGQRG